MGGPSTALIRRQNAVRVDFELEAAKEALTSSGRCFVAVVLRMHGMGGHAGTKTALGGSEFGEGRQRREPLSGVPASPSDRGADPFQGPAFG
jgi:hypothetical protein